jgi:hypothetical protein
MPTEFCFEQTFEAASPAEIIAAYFDDTHLAAQDEVAGMRDRQIVESRDDGAVWTCAWKVVSTRALPSIVKPFVPGGQLTYLETMTWYRADDRAALTVTPQLLGGRVELTGTYVFERRGERQIARRYAGAVSANVPLLSGKIERTILGEFQQQVPALAACTQRWLDARARG